MTKIIHVKGMMCDHCKMHVEKALGAIDGVTATVDLEAGTATVNAENEVSDEALEKAIVEAGYSVQK